MSHVFPEKLLLLMLLFFRGMFTGSPNKLFYFNCWKALISAAAAAACRAILTFKRSAFLSCATAAEVEEGGRKCMVCSLAEGEEQMLRVMGMWEACRGTYVHG